MIKTFDGPNSIEFLLDSNLLLGGIYYMQKWDFIRNPHVLIFGSTGSGKTYAVKLILARIGLHLKDASVTLLDFKSDDFKFCQGLPNYYTFMKCSEGLERFFQSFQRRQSGEDNNRSFMLLMFDEWASYLNMLDKKEADAARSKLSTLLMLGRSFNCHVLISQQRADAEYFAKARDNFSVVVALGNISKESALMFNFERESMQAVNGTGYGYMITNGTNMKAIKVPTVRNNEKLEYYIRKVVSQ